MQALHHLLPRGEEKCDSNVLDKTTQAIAELMSGNAS